MAVNRISGDEHELRGESGKIIFYKFAPDGGQAIVKYFFEDWVGQPGTVPVINNLIQHLFIIGDVD